VWWEGPWGLVEALTWWEPAGRAAVGRWGHTERTRRSTWERSRSTRAGKATLRTKAVLVWASRATRAAERRIATGRELTMRREVWRRLLTLLVLRRAILTLLRLWYLSHTPC
jgi:hypothetical protein